MLPDYDKYFNVACSVPSYFVAFVDRNKISGKTFYLLKFIEILFHLILSFIFLGRLALGFFILNFEKGLTLKYTFELFCCIFSFACSIYYLCILLWFKKGYIFDLVRIFKSLSNVPISYNIAYFRDLTRYRNFVLVSFISCIALCAGLILMPVCSKNLDLEFTLYFASSFVSNNFCLWILFYLSSFVQIFYYTMITLTFYLFCYPINEEMKRLYVYCKDTKNLLSLKNLTVAYNHHVKLCEAMDMFNKMFKHFIFLSYFAFCPCIAFMLCVFINGGDDSEGQQTWFIILYKVCVSQTSVCGLFIISILGARINCMV